MALLVDVVLALATVALFGGLVVGTDLLGPDVEAPRAPGTDCLVFRPCPVPLPCPMHPICERHNQ